MKSIANYEDFTHMLRSAGKHHCVAMCVHRKNLSPAPWDGCTTVQRKDLKVGRRVLDQWVQWGMGRILGKN